MAGLHMTANVHVKPETELSFSLYPTQGRVAVQIGGVGGDVTLFLPGSEIDRLAGVLADARESLSAVTAA
ncbi:hypothetical protein NMK34_03665 [Micromonospora sp. BRA006-A]|uniref:Uncharacterized protein n=1 Tax=Micromonospora echinospora TaxID=1877 RepID=A0ABR6M5A5_MICEC|nr:MULTISPECIES: hypothetical protein [Micromonospora]MBB5110545.1 hypothetical protein [Micromonospora echinospora]MDW3845698.1 hypothetical protein [Micromonospora sp. BRA006-A]MEE3919048.1 hypothetical protein [Micromonospora sp. BRA006-A]